jgi:CRISPR-associated protein Cst1
MAELTFTGDPFVDLGGLVMDTLPHKTIEDKIRFVTDVYVDNWKGKLHSIFLHSKITHISAKALEQKKQESLDYYLDIFNNIGAKSEGYCRVCSKMGPLFGGDRRNYPLAGSMELVNFNHCHEVGLLLCKDCLIKVFFIPLGVIKCGAKLMFLQIQNNYLQQFWQEEIIYNNLDNISIGSSNGIFNQKFYKPQNSLFYFAGKIIERFEELPECNLRIYYFTNYSDDCDIDIFDLPNPIFSFLKRVLRPALKKEWDYFIKKHFLLKKSAIFDNGTGEWFKRKGERKVLINFEECRGIANNTIYDFLYSGKSILRYLRSLHKEKSFPIMITVSYLKEVKRMRQEQIDLIRKIADKIIALAQKEGNYNKFLIPLEGARYASQLRAAILRSVKAQYKNGEAEPFIRFNDYVEFLFPDGQSWTEVRDFMLICLYERLHDLHVEPDQISDDDIPDIVESEDYPINRFNA